MKAWKICNYIIFGETKKDLLKNYMEVKYLNVIRRMLNYPKEKKGFNETEILRLPALDNKNMETQQELQVLFQEEKNRMDQLNEFLSNFDVMSKKELAELHMESYSILEYCSNLDKEELKEIPVSKIVGIARFSCFETWDQPFEILLSGQMDANFKSKKIDELIQYYFREQEGFFRLFNDPKTDHIYATYVEDEDIYYITSGGSHRSFLAKLLKLPTLKALVSPRIVNEK